MAIDSNGILHIDLDNETFDVILDNVAEALMDYRVTTDGGVPARDVGMLCTSPNINIWAKFKPIRVAQVFPIGLQDYHARWYGLSQSGYYFVYNRPRGMQDGYNEPYRISDFDGYNHAAECPMLDSSRLSKKVGVGLGPNKNFSIEPWNILNRSENVEIPLDVLTVFPNSMYVGVLFVNRRNGTGFYHTYEYTLQDVINDESTLYSQEIDITNAPNVLDGDTLDLYYCLGNEPALTYQTNISAVIVMCCDETHGHAVVSIISLGYENLMTYLPTVYNEYTGTNAVFTRMEILLRVNFALEEYPNASLPITFRAKVNGNLFGTRSFTISNGSVGDDKLYTIEINGHEEVSQGELEDNQYEVPIALDAKFDNDTEWRQFGYGTYNVADQSVSEWHYVNQQ